MLIKFKDIVSKYGTPKGIIHMGAHLMEERNDYLLHGLENTIWVEANPSKYKSISGVNDTPTPECVFNYAITDTDNQELDFHITNNGESSSILSLGKHVTHHPHIHVTETIKVNTKRLDSLIKENSIDISSYNFLNIDIQGAELLALKGAGNLINSIDFIYTEVNTAHLYKNCALIEEIDYYLSHFGFSRKETEMTEYEWGDALYVK